MNIPARSAPTINSDTFCDRFLTFVDGRFTADQIKRGDAIPRRQAAAVLAGISWRLIPTVVVEGRQLVSLQVLMMLCACLDDPEVGASPGSVSHDQLLLAWMAAGQEKQLRRETLNALCHRAVVQTLASNLNLITA